MSKELSQQRLYSQSDFRKADRLDRIFIYLQQPDDFHLSQPDFEYYMELVGAYAIMCEHHQESIAIRMILGSRSDHISEAKAWRLMNDVKRLFGNVIQRNKEFERSLLRDRLHQLAEFNHDAGDLAEERRCLQAIIKMDALDKHQKTGGVDPRTMVPAQIEITSDPKALNAEDAQIVDDGLEE